MQPSLIPAVVSAFVRGLLLAVALCAIWCLLWLLMERSATESAAIDRGLVPLFESMSSPPCSWISGPLSRVSWLQSTSSAVWTMICTALGAVIIRIALGLVIESTIEKHVARVVLRLRQHLHRTAIRLEPADLTGEQQRETSRLFQDSARTVEATASHWGFTSMTVWPDLFVCLVIPVISNWRVALQVLIPVLLGRMLLQWESRRSDASLRLLSDQVRRGLSRLAESLRKTRIVSSFGMEQQEQQGLAGHLTEYASRCQDLRRQQRQASGIRSLIMISIIAVPAVLLAMHVLRGWHPSLALLFGGCLYIVDRLVTKLPVLDELAASGSDAADEIAAYINRIPSVSQAPGARFLEPMSKTLTFNQVSWQSPQHPGLIRDLDLRINQRERVALLSLNPAANYALASMIPRFIDPDLGQVLIDGRDIREATLESLRAEAIFVGGSDPVFNASVLENITCGHRDITRQQAVDAAKLVHADHFIRTLPKGYETQLGEHGIALDHGQSFRLNLARAIVREPALLVIEEPAAPLDAETKAMLDDTYQRIGDDRALVFLPSRLSTVKKCTRIVLIHDGRVAVDGTHEQLVRSNELYRHWEYLRFNPFRDDPES